MARHLDLDELNAGLSKIRQSPSNNGTLEAIVIRPAENQRIELKECQISRESGVQGDKWSKECWLTLPDGSPHPDVQISITNARSIALIARERDKWPLVGDNLYIDFDISEENLPPGQKVQIGSVVIEISDTANIGCKKFAERYGKEAARFVSSAEGQRLRLRGLFARVLQDGVVSVGDNVKKY